MLDTPLMLWELSVTEQRYRFRRSIQKYSLVANEWYYAYKRGVKQTPVAGAPPMLSICAFRFC
jgi:hypothetical protein